MIRTLLIEDEEEVPSFFARFKDDSKCVSINVPYAQKYYRTMIENKMGQVFLLCDEETGSVHGGLACIKGPVPHSGQMVAVELFWYVAPEYRGSLGALELLVAFENWAKENQCSSCALIHMMDSQPERLEKLYLRMGYKLLEKHYIKEV
jgi:hypothetical protein